MKTKTLSKRVMVRLSPETEIELRRLAIKEQRSFGQMIRIVLTEYLKRHNGHKVA